MTGCTRQVPDTLQKLRKETSKDEEKGRSGYSNVARRRKGKKKEAGPAQKLGPASARCQPNPTVSR